MSTVSSKRYYTPQEYLELEERSDTKHEYWNGEIFAMSGVSLKHDRAAEDIRRLAGNHLVGAPCEVFSSDVRVKVSATGVYTYPDASIACDAEPEVIAGVQTLINPVLVVEVLSDSTEVIDRGKKLGQYIQIPSLREYLIVAQDEMRVDHLLRTNEENWRLTIHTQPHAVIRLECISFDLPLSEIYRRVKFPEDSVP